LRLPIFADRQYLPDRVPHFALLYPFWGPSDDEAVSVNQGVFARFMQVGAEHFALTDLDAARFAVFPAAWERAEVTPAGRERAEALAAEAAAHGKPMVVFFRSDYENPLNLPNSRIFRTSLTRSRRQPGEYVLPAWSADFVDSYCDGKLILREKGARPVVGFCGDVSSGSSRWARAGRMLGARPSIWRLARRAGLELIRHPGSRLRLHALHYLSRSPDVALNAVVRYGHWNRAVYRGRVLDPAGVVRSRQEYAANMIESDYVLCARGKGNYSYRLYETLSCGRIPVLIDTDAVLPYEDWIDWKQYVVWVEADALHTIPERVAAFHARLSPAQFRDLQTACRQLWLDWLSPQGFFGNLGRLDLKEAR
jgi:hypothetical protein